MLLPIMLFLLLLGLLFFYNFYYKRRNLPPGPWPLPLLGNLRAFKHETPEHCFLRWRRQYGDVFTMWMGEVPVVCVADYAKIMETFQKDGDTYAGRYNNNALERMLRGGIFGVIFTEGNLWREQRRFALHIFRDFGVGKNLMQNKILSEMELMFERIDGEIGLAKEVNIAELLDLSVGSIINNLLFGYRFDDEHLDEFREIKRLLRLMIENSFHPLRIVFAMRPDLLRRLPLLGRFFEEMRKRTSDMQSFFSKQIKVHLEEIDLDDLDAPPQDLVEAFLREKAKRDATGEPHDYTLEQLNGLCNDLWIAGQETTSTTLAWGIAYLIAHPDVQAKVQTEIDRLIDAGSDNGSKEQQRRLITVSDRAALHYTNATINEIQRLANLVPINLMHKLTRDVVIDGYQLRKGCAITPQISAVLADDKIFDNPNEFRPERFLDEAGKLKRVDELIPFSIGKRQCLGEPLARMELFLFFANLLNQYKFSAGTVPPSFERKLGGAALCPEYRCRIEKRSNSNSSIGIAQP